MDLIIDNCMGCKDDYFLELKEFKIKLMLS